MENKRRIFRIVTALIALAVVATMCVLLVACDPEGKEGGETAAGGGDAIFTEDATLAELTEKINAAESFVVSSNDTYTNSTGTYTNKWEYRLDGKTLYITQNYKDYPTYYECSYSADGYDYEAYSEEGGLIDMSKSLSEYGGTKELVTGVLETFKKEYVSPSIAGISPFLVRLRTSNGSSV